MTEEWLPCSGFEGRYEVSSLGRVRSTTRSVAHWKGGYRIVKSKVMSLRINKGGYVQCNMYDDTSKGPRLVHRLVSKTFIWNPKKLPCVNHKNFDRADNTSANLEWVTTRENVHFSVREGHYHPSTNPNIARKFNLTQVENMRKLRSEGHTLENIAAAHGSTRSYVGKICSGKSWPTILTP